MEIQIGGHMNRLSVGLIAVFSVIFIMVGCSGPLSPLVEDETETSSDLIDIDYNNPSAYTINGSQTTLDGDALAIIENEYTLEQTSLGLGGESTELDFALNLHRMLFENYVVDQDGDGAIEVDPNGNNDDLFYDSDGDGNPEWNTSPETHRHGDIQWEGGSPGQNVTVSELLTADHSGGCTATALIYASVLRHYGIPAIVVHTVSVDWARDQEGGHRGHVFVEMYVDGDWYLVDVIQDRIVFTSGGDNLYDESMVWIDRSYDSDIRNDDEYYIFAKVIDNYEHAELTNNQDYYELMDDFYYSYQVGDETYPESYSYQFIRPRN